MFTTLRKLCTDEINNKYSELQEEIKTEDGFKRVSKWYNKTYIKNPQQKLSKFLDNIKNKEIEEMNQDFLKIEQSEEFKGEFVITIEWIRSRTWGYNPKVFANNGFEYKGISGCGYDKQSTATAYALNSNLSILKLLYKKKEEAINNVSYKNESNRTILGYGSGYNILPRFEESVGIGSHEHILSNIGLEMIHIANTNQTDVFVIKLKEDK